MSHTSHVATVIAHNSVDHVRTLWCETLGRANADVEISLETAVAYLLLAAHLEGGQRDGRSHGEEAPSRQRLAGRLRDLIP